MTELEKYKVALDALMCRFRSIAGLMDLTAAERETEAILNPFPVYEPVEEIVGWVNVYQDAEGGVYPGGCTHADEEAANTAAELGFNPRISCQPIKVTVQREKKQPVERSAKVVLSKELWVIETTGDELPAESFKATLTWEE